MIRRRISITVETDRILFMRQTKDSTKSWCDVCSRQVEMLRVADLSDSVVANLSTMFGEAEATRLHVVKAPSGITFVCLNFLGT